MRFTKEIFDIYRDLAKARAQSGDANAADGAAVMSCFAELESHLDPPIRWQTRLDLREAMKTVGPKYDGLTDAGLRVFLRCAIEYLQERLIDVPRIIYIPWAKADATELADWAERWRKFDEKRKRFDVFCYGEKAFENLHALAQVYILGHGGPGLSFLAKTNKPMPYGNDQEANRRFVKKEIDPVDFTIVYSRMRADGLDPEKFVGAFKVYACSGGAEGAPNPLFNTKGESFVVSFARYMRSKLFTNCAFYGYSQDLSAPTSFELAGGRSLALSDGEKELIQKMTSLDLIQKALAGVSPTNDDVRKTYQTYLRTFTKKPGTARVTA